MELSYAAKQRLTDYEGRLMSVQDYLETHQILVEQSRTVSTYKANPDAFPAKSLEEFLALEVPDELDAITAEFEHGLRHYINQRYEQKRAKINTQPKILEIKESIEDFLHYVFTGELIVRKELTNEDVAASYRRRSMIEMGEHMITIADKMLLTYLKWQYTEENKGGNKTKNTHQEQLSTLEGLKEYYSE